MKTSKQIPYEISVFFIALFYCIAKITGIIWLYQWKTKKNMFDELYWWQLKTFTFDVSRYFSKKDRELSAEMDNKLKTMKTIYNKPKN